MPERVVTPSGKILDENELLFAIDNEKELEKRREIVEAYYYYLAVRHPKRHIDEIVAGRSSFINEIDMNRAFTKYLYHRQ